MEPKDDRPLGEDDEIPRRGILASMPKRTFYRVVVLLAALAGIIYLRQRTSAIASCMSNAFQVAPSGQRSESPVRARIELPAKPPVPSPP
jgi:hypothetical protein